MFERRYHKDGFGICYDYEIYIGRKDSGGFDDRSCRFFKLSEEKILNLLNNPVTKCDPESFEVAEIIVGVRAFEHISQGDFEKYYNDYKNNLTLPLNETHIEKSTGTEESTQVAG
jgi:hypothetical protein